MKDFLLRTPINHRAKFGAANFIVGKEIRNRTNYKTKKTNKQKNSKQYIRTLPINMCG